MNATIKDVARMAGVSISTVSRVINDHPAVRPTTRDAVSRAMQKLGFRPNQLARGLVGNRTYNIGLAISSAMMQFYAETSRAIQDEALSRGYNLILFHHDAAAIRRNSHGAEGAGPLRQLVATLPVDGFILVITGTDDRLAVEIARSHHPLVVVNRDLSPLGIDSVLADEAAVVREAAELLIGLGHRHIGFIRGEERNITSQMRFEGYREAVEKAGLRQFVSGFTDLDVAGGYRGMKELLGKDASPTAVIAINDQAALGALKAVHEAGLSVPRDVSLIGFDNRDFTTYLEPALTTISKPKYDMGLEAAKLLFSLLVQDGRGSREPARRVLLAAELVARESCAPPARGDGA